MRGWGLLVVLASLGCQQPPTEAVPVPPPSPYALEAADLGVFCEGWVDGTCYDRLPPAVLAPGELVFARIEQSEMGAAPLT